MSVWGPIADGRSVRACVRGWGAFSVSLLSPLQVGKRCVRWGVRRGLPPSVLPCSRGRSVLRNLLTSGRRARASSMLGRRVIRCGAIRIRRAGRAKEVFGPVRAGRIRRALGE